MRSEIAYVPGIDKYIFKSVFRYQNMAKLFPPKILFVGLMIPCPRPCSAAYVSTYPFVHVSWQFQA